MSVETGDIHDETLTAIAQAKVFLYKEYLQGMDVAKPIGTADSRHDALRLIHLDALLYDRQEDVSEKLKALFGAVESYGESIMLVINGKKDKADIYLGVATEEQPPQPVFETFLRSLNSLLPGCQYKVQSNAAIRGLIDDVLPTMESIHISSVAAFPAEEKERGGLSQRLDALIEGMKHQPFSMILLSRAILPDTLSVMRQQMQRLYTELSPLERAILTLSHSNSKSMGENLSQAVTDSIGFNMGVSYGQSTSHGSTTRKQGDDDRDKLRQHQGKLHLAGTAASLLLSGPEASLLQSLFYGSALTNILSSSEQVFGVASPSASAEDEISIQIQEAKTEQKQKGYSGNRARNQQAGINASLSSTQGETQQTTQINKAIAELLSTLEKQLQQLSVFQQEGAFQTAAYFIAGDSETAVSAANLYRSICTSHCRPTLRSPICEWSGVAEVAMIRKYLACGQHPVFHFEKSDALPAVQMAQMIGLSDMPRFFALPEHTVPGMIVSQSARFARDIVAKDSAGSERENQAVHIGCIYHMGKEDSHTEVHLDLNSLTKHLFVSGATGVGKSNFCYQLLDELDRQGIRMLVIEPAKGEYRHVMGGREGFAVYGVDPAAGPVLRINPFACPDGIPIIQHIERLLDIFNTAWPMYSAMPAILKEAVELIYTDRGFNLLGHGRPKGVEFPCFGDLLEALPRVINQSSYSSEVKGNYTGALVTRVKSLTNGLYGIIFSQDEIGDEALFNANVIADISRIGSAETKALLMGVLTARLVEFRMAEGRINAPLRHVTVLEEAHNLLRRHHPSSEGGGARAASVEALAAAIAEMRSSGEGFIIADQSPSVMDMSVIRNTQTKVFFMLPDKEDRMVAASSLSLDENQQQEIAKLRSGVAVVYQNGWTDAVLCKIDYFVQSRARPFLSTPIHVDVDYRVLLGQATAALLRRRMSSDESSLDEDCIQKCLGYDATILNQEGKVAHALLRKRQRGQKLFDNPEEEFGVVCRILPLERILRSAVQVKNIEQWEGRVSEEISRRVAVTKAELDALVTMGLYRWSRKDSGAKGLYVRHLEHRSAISKR